MKDHVWRTIHPGSPLARTVADIATDLKSMSCKQAESTLYIIKIRYNVYRCHKCSIHSIFQLTLLYQRWVLYEPEECSIRCMLSSMIFVCVVPIEFEFSLDNSGQLSVYVKLTESVMNPTKKESLGKFSVFYF